MDRLIKLLYQSIISKSDILLFYYNNGENPYQSHVNFLPMDIKESHMIGSDRAASDWLTLESNLIHVMIDMESKWNSAIEAARKCRGLKRETPGQCAIYLDKALEEARDMEILISNYVKILTEMKDMVQYK